ncbi:MAG: flagellar hook-length control protein FliK [Acetatifactor sp.]|nr:flagellar hook-length control protein FliK [Acetatifactor sp.]
MNLSELFFGNNQISNSIQTPAGESYQSKIDAGAALTRTIMSLIPGSTITGEILSRENDLAEVKIAGDMILNAKIDASISLETGKPITFEVKNNGRNLSLSPLFTNTASSQTATKALNMASLPVNDITLAMTRNMMGKGMSIDINSLQNTYKDIINFGNDKMDSIISLREMNCPVNEKTLQEYKAVSELEFKMEEGFAKTFDSLRNVFNSLSEGGNTKEAVSLLNDLQNLYETFKSESEVNNVNGEQVKNLLPDGDTAETGFTLKPASEPVNNGNTLETVSNESGKTLLNEGGDLNTLDTAKGTVGDKGSLISSDPYGLEKTYGSADPDNKIKSENINPNEKNGNNGSGIIKNNGSYFSGEVFNEIPDKETVDKFFDKLKTMVHLNEKELASKEEVREHFSKVSKMGDSLGKILDNLEVTDRTAALLKETVTGMNNLSENLEFINQFNNLYTFMQMPFKSLDGQEDGDLYIYANKKHLADSDGTITAFLHLKTNNMGPVDVYVAMTGENISTDFYVENDRILDFLEANMDLLNRRLTEKGYNLEVNASLSKDMKNNPAFPGSMQGNGTGEAGKNVPSGEYSFDVRT